MLGDVVVPSIVSPPVCRAIGSRCVRNLSADVPAMVVIARLVGKNDRDMYM